jgi:hypothetical protein
MAAVLLMDSTKSYVLNVRGRLAYGTAQAGFSIKSSNFCTTSWPVYASLLSINTLTSLPSAIDGPLYLVGVGLATNIAWPSRRLASLSNTDKL